MSDKEDTHPVLDVRGDELDRWVCFKDLFVGLCERGYFRGGVAKVFVTPKQYLAALDFAATLVCGNAVFIIIGGHKIELIIKPSNER